MSIPIGTPLTGFERSRALSPEGYVWVCNLMLDAASRQERLVAVYGDDVRFTTPGYSRTGIQLGEASVAVYLKQGRNLMEHNQPKRKETK